MYYNTLFTVKPCRNEDDIKPRIGCPLWLVYED